MNKLQQIYRIKFVSLKPSGAPLTSGAPGLCPPTTYGCYATVNKREEDGSGHGHGVAMCSRFPVEVVGGSEARDFCFYRYLRKAFHRLVGTIRSTVPGQGTRIPVSRPCLLLFADAAHQTHQRIPTKHVMHTLCG